MNPQPPIVARLPSPGSPWAQQITDAYRLEHIALAGERPALIEVAATADDRTLTVSATAQGRTVTRTISPSNMTADFVTDLTRLMVLALTGHVLATSQTPDADLPADSEGQAWAALLHLGAFAHNAATWDMLARTLEPTNGKLREGNNGAR